VSSGNDAQLIAVKLGPIDRQAISRNRWEAAREKTRMIQAAALLDDIADVQSDPSIARRQEWARFLPTVMVRFTARGGTGGDGWIYPTPRDLIDWPVPLGLTFEVRAVWGLGRFADPMFLSHGGGR
jgi:hypothetical protein